jgi:hypothetical protein
MTKNMNSTNDTGAAIGTALGLDASDGREASAC